MDTAQPQNTVAIPPGSDCLLSLKRALPANPLSRADGTMRRTITTTFDLVNTFGRHPRREVGNL
jgi:hypothetical protein